MRNSRPLPQAMFKLPPSTAATLSPRQAQVQVPMAMPQAAQSVEASRAQAIAELHERRDLSYEEYQREYRRHSETRE